MSCGRGRCGFAGLLRPSGDRTVGIPLLAKNARNGAPWSEVTAASAEVPSASLRAGSSSGGLRLARRTPLPQDDKSKLLSQAREMWHPTEIPCNAEGSAKGVRDPSTTRDGSRGSPSCSAQDDKSERYSSNMGTWRWSSVGPRRGRRVAPITARTVSDSRAVRGTKMRWVFERWSGGFTR
jgi:hypothetical protein